MSDSKLIEKNNLNLILKAIIFVALVFVEFEIFIYFGELVHISTITDGMDTNPGHIILYFTSLLNLILIGVNFILMIVTVKSQNEKTGLLKALDIMLYIIIGLFIAQLIMVVLIFADIG